MWIYANRPGLVYLVVFLILMAVSFLGYRLGYSAIRRRPEMPILESFVPSTIFGLLTLILAFSFSLAVSRFENRLRLGVEECNAIGTAGLRVALLQPPHRQQTFDLIKRYLDLRIEYYKAPINSSAALDVEARTEKVQDQIWKTVIQATRQNRGPIESITVESLNSMFDLRNSRNIALTKTLPRTIYWTILLIAAVGVSTFNFQRGQKQEHGQWQVAIVIMVMTFAYVLILDLDRPTSGTIQISQDAMLALREELSHH